MPNQFYHELYNDFINTFIALLIIAVGSLVTLAIIIKKSDSQRRKHRLRIRGLYIAAMLFLFVIARIWVEGFTHLLAVLGLVSAALVVTNKETIMNFVGWLIITWRELFVENDLVQIQQYKGYVKRIGILYFTLAEVSETIPNNITGRIIRVPNGLASNNVLINFSQTSHLLEQTISYKISATSEVSKDLESIKKTVNTTIQNFYKDKKEYSLDYLKARNKFLDQLLTLDINISMAAKSKEDSNLEIIISYYCFEKDVQTLKNLIYLELYKH